MPQPSAMYSISYQKPENLVRLTWLDGTEGMTDEDFKQTLAVFAESVMQHRAERLVIDVREFRHRPSKEVLAWRDEAIVPKYNKSGAKKLAWIWPGDVSSMKPDSTGKAYQDVYFSTEEEALAWLAE